MKTKSIVRALLGLTMVLMLIVACQSGATESSNTTDGSDNGIEGVTDQELADEAKRLEILAAEKADSVNRDFYLGLIESKYEEDKQEIERKRDYEIEARKLQLATNWLGENASADFAIWKGIVEKDKENAAVFVEEELRLYEEAKLNSRMLADSLDAHSDMAALLTEADVLDFDSLLSLHQSLADEFVNTEAEAYAAVLADYKSKAEKAAKEKAEADRIAREKAEKEARERAELAAKLAEEKRCRCRPRTFRSRSDHTWVEFRLPEAPRNQVIQIPGGSYNKYVFPKCNRVHWTDLTFKCVCGNWKRTKGDWDADAWCHGSPGNSPYVKVGVH